MEVVVPEIDLDAYLPDEFDTLSLSQVAAALKTGMKVRHLLRANAQCPFCDGMVQAAIVGNAQRIDLVCYQCHKSYTQSFRSALDEPVRIEPRQFETVIKKRRG